MIVWVLLALVVVLVAAVVWLLRPGPHGVRGGQLDLTRAAARGDLDLTWDCPPGAGRVENGDDISAPTTWAA